MKWQGRRKSSNVEDRRGQSGGGMNFGGNGGRGISPFLLGPLVKLLFSKTGIVIIGGLVLVMWLSGTNPISLLAQFTGGGQATQVDGNYQGSAEEEQLAAFTSVVLADTEDVWHTLMQNYREPGLVLFTDGVASACGTASSATGPFYCPGDEKVYIDLTFFQDMGKTLGAHGDFAQAYVIAHEVGHHVQKLDGTLGKVQEMREEISEVEYNKLMVMLELQADFYAGVWAHHTQKVNNILEEGDLEEALNAASSVGDDRLQKRATGKVVPDSFTHGTSEQRARWFKLGFDTGDVSLGDTFNAARL